MILVIDNYDSFVYTLSGYVETLGFNADVCRNDEIALGDIEKMKPEAIILSPGPCTPNEAGICVEAVKSFAESIPILGVCLGHQAIGEAYGGETIKASQPVHGKASEIFHEHSALFKNIPSPFNAGRYHSLVISLPENSPLHVTGWTEDEVIMAVQHHNHPVFGVQFHPESLLSKHGMDVLKNFLYVAQDWNKRKSTS